MATTRAPRFSPGLSQEELASGYKKVGSRRRISRVDVTKALKPYGLKPSKARKGASDAALARVAGKAVVGWHKKQKTKAKKK